MKITRILLCVAMIFALFLVTPARSNDVDDPLVDNLTIAYQIGTAVGHPEIIQAIMFKESRGILSAVGGANLPPNNRSYGLMQIQIRTARAVLKKNTTLIDEFNLSPKLTDREIIKLLTTNSVANITIGATYYNMLYDMLHSHTRALAAYNMGVANALRCNTCAYISYVKDVFRIRDTVITTYNKENNDVRTRDPESLPVVR